jgi:uncharacterized membrane protein YfcA
MAEIILVLFAGGLLAGMLGGLLGIGGGIVLMPVLRFMIGLPPAQASGVCILAVLFTTLGGSYRHYKQGNLKAKPMIPVMISGAVATIIFSLIFPHFSKNVRWFDLGIGLVFSLVSIRMIIEGVPGLIKKKTETISEKQIGGSILQKIGIGSIAGALPGLLGIGTGVILVPAFTYLLSAPIKIAVASSLMCFSVNALISSAFKYLQGFIDLNLALPACIGTLIGAYLGAMINKRMPSQLLKLLFGLVFSYVSLKFIFAI